MLHVLVLGPRFEQGTVNPREAIARTLLAAKAWSFSRSLWLLLLSGRPFSRFP